MADRTVYAIEHYEDGKIVDTTYEVLTDRPGAEVSGVHLAELAARIKPNIPYENFPRTEFQAGMQGNCRAEIRRGLNPTEMGLLVKMLSSRK